MDMRIPLGATFAALLILPLGVLYMNNTALTPPDFGPVAQQPAPAAPVPMAESMLVDAATQRIGVIPMRTQEYGTMPAGGDRFTAFDDNGVMLVADDPVSTFSIDVDTAAYAYVRRMLDMGQLPPPDAVRVEELINYFSYDYAAPQGGVPFETSLAVSPSPWNAENRLIQIGIQGEDMALDTVPPANLVLLIDTSGSMDAPDKLPLLKRAFTLLVNEMGPQDTISIVTYAGSAGVVLEPTPAGEKAKILAALEDLAPGGSTAGAQGIEAAYRLAEQAMIAGGTNRVLLATDGDFNVGLSDPEALEDLIEAKRDRGIFLSVLGFGTGNYHDSVMQALAQAGNGNAAYIDSYSEARKVLVEELGGTLVTIAKDVKIQVEFNPATVSEYRLIGYETRVLDREDFNNDAVDAGDIGAGHSVTALYEITPVGARGAVDPLRYGEAVAAGGGSLDEYGFLKLRYKAPDGDVSTLIETPMLVEGEDSIARADADFATAVAAFGQKLKGSPYLRAMEWADIRALAEAGRGSDPTGRRAEFIRLVDMAASLN
ncbi:vWA domain-containing protein [Pelagibacterium lacus]|uniref:VWA domain-containing protein n=1 Tax=Pelagibacterium lacus TaxID=2282655 RepID=A0A369W1J0_9HYPH|nr:VWA domain-containing protein [Pelagibacterium lacus]RDE08233.1 VWA domain-containing protein [Pelagibacterium lacus]